MKSIILDKIKIGLAVGLFLAIVHAIWAILIAVIPTTLQSFLNWIFNIHFLEPLYTLTQFNFVGALSLIVMTFVFGFIFGWIFAWTHNIIYHKKK